MAKKIPADAAEIIEVAPRTIRRWRARLEEHGYDELRDRRRGKPSERRVPLETCERVLALYQERYFDLSVRRFHEAGRRPRHQAQLQLGQASAAGRRPGSTAGQARAAPQAPSAAADRGCPEFR